MWQRFTMPARNTMALGQDKAIELQRNEVGTDLILWALISQPEDAAAQILQSLNAPSATIRARLEAEFAASRQSNPKAAKEPKITAGTRRVLEYSAEEARQLNKTGGDIGSEHILLGLLRQTEDTPLSYTLLRDAGVTLEKVHEWIQRSHNTAM